MNARQIALPFRFREAWRRANPNLDLLGRAYTDGNAVITIVGICPNDESRVLVERDHDGATWSMPAWLMRLIFMENKRRKRAA